MARNSEQVNEELVRLRELELKKVENSLPRGGEILRIETVKEKKYKWSTFNENFLRVTFKYEGKELLMRLNLLSGQRRLYF